MGELSASPGCRPRAFLHIYLAREHEESWAKSCQVSFAFLGCSTGHYNRTCDGCRQRIRRPPTFSRKGVCHLWPI